MAVAALLALACGGRDLTPAPSRKACATHADCPRGETCHGPGELSPRSISPARPPDPIPCPWKCTTSASCDAGQRCEATSGPCGSVCIADCGSLEAKPCPSNLTCLANGQCGSITCEDPAYPGCPTGMVCGIAGGMSDPAAPTNPTGTDQPTPSEQQTRALEQGCVFLKCDQSGGFDCRDGYRCDPPSAQPGSTGCAAIPCSEGASCETDDYLCEPSTTDHAHVSSDPHGCVLRNCDEGYTCPASTRCDLTQPGYRGCVNIPCDQPGGSCSATTKCNPHPEPLPSGRANVVDAFGCVAKTCWEDGVACASGAICDPSDPSSSSIGCATPPPPPSVAGAGGSAGSAGGSAGASAQGGAASGGSGALGGSSALLGVCE